MTEDYFIHLQRITLLAMLVVLGLVLVLVLLGSAHAAVVGEASWYSVESCKREGTWQKWGGRMANGEIFDDTRLICAAWDFAFKTRLRITNLENGKTVIVEVSDRGPSKRLYRQGRILDLSKGAFAQIASLKQGVIKVKVEVLP